MKKEIITVFVVVALILGIGSVSFANNNPIKIFLNGYEITSDVEPKNVNGRIIAPVRSIAEALGATLAWDVKSNQVYIESEQIDQKSQIYYLEQALAPKDHLTAVNSWAEGVKSRNGALQYAVMATDLKKESYNDFAAFNWVTGASSPWVKSYKVTELARIDNDTYRYEVEFIWTTSTNETARSKSCLTIRNYNGTWLISAIEN